MTLADRPIYEGLPVPYVAAWTDERNNAWDPNNLQWWRGIRWLRTTKTTGIPLFGMTNSYRQRECMRRGRCQVCGEKGATTWVIPDDGEGHHHTLWTSERLVLNPPMHAECYIESKKLCPHLVAKQPLAVIVNPALITYTACSATRSDGLMTAVVTLEQAREEHWIGRELVVQLS
jgi:hypothetical protein